LGAKQIVFNQEGFDRQMSEDARLQRGPRVACCLHFLIYETCHGNLGILMPRQCCVVALLLIVMPTIAWAGYLDENPDEVFSSVYQRLGVLPVNAARDPAVWVLSKS
jgi:hypothetical protein